MAVVKNSLNLLDEEDLTEEVSKYSVLYGKSHKRYVEKDVVNNAWMQKKEVNFWKMVRSYRPMYEHLFPRTPLNDCF